jgi:ABC-2 type transport system permease protein
MKLNRIWAITLRYLYLFKHNPDKSVDIFYWPLVDLILWGITGLFISSLDPNYAKIVVIIVSGLVFWQVVWRGQIEVTINILEELWNKNLVNIFATPLKFSEWITSFVVLSISKMIVSLAFISGLSFIMYKVNILQFGIYLAPFIVLLIMSGWWIGIFVGAVILRQGTRIQNLAWSFPWAISPFSAIFYPISILPIWAQKISLIFPTSYIFEGIREIINTGHLDPYKLIMSFVLNIFYLCLALIFLNHSYKSVLKRGLSKIY